VTQTIPSTKSEQPAARRRSGVRNVLDRIGVQNISLMIALVLLVALIGSQDSKFFLGSNIRIIGTSAAIIGVLAVGQTIIIILGALDISVGSMAGLASVSSAMIFVATSNNAGLGIGFALLLGISLGLLNGCIVVFGRVNPIIATLATLAAYKGLAQLVSDGRAQGYTGADPVFVFLARGSVLGIPTLVVVFGLVALGAHLLLAYTDIGRNIYAIGGNDSAARLAGININKYILACYALTGMLAALAGILITARTGSGQPISGSEGLELEAITAAALGGCSFKGGRGAIGGTVLAVILLGVLSNGMTLLDINSFWQNVAKGTLLVVAVVVQQARSGERRIGIPT
jgi:ribose transport system permease protein